MDSGLQELLGVKKVDDPSLPGTRPREAGQVIYMILPAGADLVVSFETVTSKVHPPIPKHGGALLKPWVIQTSDGENFYSIYFHGDVEGWRQQIEFGATQLGLNMAKVIDDKFILSGGPTFLLSECTITLDGSPFALPGPESPTGAS